MGEKHVSWVQTWWQNTVFKPPDLLSMCRTVSDTWAQFILMLLFCVTSIANSFCLFCQFWMFFCFFFCTVIEYRTMKKRENTENYGARLFKMWCWAVWDASGIKVVITGEDLNRSETVHMFWNQFLQESLFLFFVFFWKKLVNAFNYCLNLQHNIVFCRLVTKDLFVSVRITDLCKKRNIIYNIDTSGLCLIVF